MVAKIKCKIIKEDSSNLNVVKNVISIYRLLDQNGYTK